MEETRTQREIQEGKIGATIEDVTMKLELFTQAVKRQGISIIDTTDPIFDKIALHNFRTMKEFFNYIDFDCHIKKDGTGCKEFNVKVGTTKCCCNSCRSSVGYFRYMLDQNFKYYARIFNQKTGFWREKKGCILPRRMRSITCLTHHCNYNQKPNFYYGIGALKEKLYELRKKI
jgi:hypothetical protein